MSQVSRIVFAIVKVVKIVKKSKLSKNWAPISANLIRTKNRVDAVTTTCVYVHSLLANAFIVQKYLGSEIRPWGIAQVSEYRLRHHDDGQIAFTFVPLCHAEDSYWSLSCMRPWSRPFVLFLNKQDPLYTDSDILTPRRIWHWTNWHHLQKSIGDKNKSI